MNLPNRGRYRVGPWHIQTGLYGSWWHDDYDGAEDSHDGRAGHGMRTYSHRNPHTTFHDALTEIAEYEREYDDWKRD